MGLLERITNVLYDLVTNSEEFIKADQEMREKYDGKFWLSFCEMECKYLVGYRANDSDWYKAFDELGDCERFAEENFGKFID